MWGLLLNWFQANIFTFKTLSAWLLLARCVETAAETGSLLL